MTTAAPTITERVFETQAMTPHGRADFWLDAFCTWHVGGDDLEFSEMVNGHQWEEVAKVLDHGQVARALEAAEEYLAVEFREMVEALKNPTGAGTREWQSIFDRLGEFHKGLVHYFYEVELVNEEVEDLNAGFGFMPRSFTLDNGRREFELRGIELWVELEDAPSGGQVELLGKTVELAEVFDVSGDQQDQVIAANLDLVDHYAAHLRYLLNKMRAGATIGQYEINRLGHWGLEAAVLSRQLEVL